MLQASADFWKAVQYLTPESFSHCPNVKVSTNGSLHAKQSFL